MQPVKPIARVFFTTWEAVSLPKLVLLIGPMVIILIAILGIALQLNRQLSDQQQANLNNIANSSIRNAAQLQRENLRLYAIISGTDSKVDTNRLKLQRDLVDSRIKVLNKTLYAASPSAEVQQLYLRYVTHWQTVEPLLATWQQQPQNLTRKADLLIQLDASDKIVNQLVSATQLHFEDRMISWTSTSRFLNRLLTGASMSFIFIVLLMTYIIFLFFRTQSLNERVLRLSERRLRAILDTIPDAVYRVDQYSTYVDYKPAKETARSPEIEAKTVPTDNRDTPETFIGKKIADVLPAEVATALNAAVQAVLTDGEEKLIEYRLPLEQPAKQRTFEARCFPGGVDEVQIIVRDITAAKQLEAASLQAQKLESLGVLAGGIAHDFNNLLTGMLGQASLAKTKLARGLPALEHINKAVISAERAADLTRQMLAYAGKGKFQIGPLNLNQLIRDTAGLMDTALPSQARLQLVLDEQLPSIQADRGQIQQVVMNLFINAIEALSSVNEKQHNEYNSFALATPAIAAHVPPHITAPPNEESIVISTGTVDISAEYGVNGYLMRDTLKPGRYVVLKVTDTGMGMEQVTLNRIFDPFFSTKPKGHGLGLSATMGIIRAHSGTLQVQSQLSQGTTFTVWLPALVESAAKAPNVPELTLTPCPKHQTILVIDDEVLIREAIVDILAEDGFTVRTAANGKEGIACFRADRQQIGLILLDMKMPGLNGKQTYAELKAIDPELKVIFTSGDSEVEAATQADPNQRVTFLPKPYNAETLLQQVHRMMAA